MSAEAPWLDAPVVEDPEPWKQAPVVEDSEQPWLSAPVVEDVPTETIPAGHPDRFAEIVSPSREIEGGRVLDPKLPLPGRVVDMNKRNFRLDRISPEVAATMKPIDRVKDEELRQREREMGIAPFSLGPEGVQDAISESKGGGIDRPLITLPKPENQGVGTGIARGIESEIEGLTSFQNLALMTGIGRAGKTVQQGAALGFGAGLMKSAYDELENAPAGETEGEKAERITRAAFRILLGTVAAKHGVSARPAAGGLGPGETRPPSLSQAEVDAALVRPVTAPEGPTVAGETTRPASQGEAPLLQSGESPLAESATTSPENVKLPAETRSQNPVPAQTTAEGAPGSARGGPGAMGPVEAGEMSAASRVTGTKNEQMRLEREARGEEAIVREQPIANRESIDQARVVLTENPNRGAEIVERLKTSNQDVRSISTADEAILMAHKVELMKQRAEQEAIYADGNRAPEEHAVAAQRLTEIEAKMNDVDQATYASGAEWGRMGQLRQRLLREDYSFEAMERRARIQKGDALTPQESATIKEQATKIADLETKLTEATKKADVEAAEKASETSFSDIQKQAEASSSPESKFAPRVLALAESIVTRLETAAEASKQSLRERLKRTSAGVDPTIVYDVAVIGVAKLARKSLDFGKWSAEMISDLGEGVQPYLPEAWKKTEELWKAEEKKVSAADRPAVNRVRQKNLDEGQKQTALATAIADAAKRGDSVGDLKQTVQSLALSFVRKGVKDREVLIDQVHEVLKANFPDIERAQTRDLISGYGDFKALDKEAAKVTLRGLKGEMQQVSKIEDMKAKQAPKKTGVERRNPTDEERRLIKEVNELKKKGGFQVTDPATQLKTAMGAIKTRLQNEIRDLETALATHERIPGKKSSIEYDAEATALKAQRDARRAQYDEMFPKEPLTPEQQLARTGAALDNSIAKLEADIKAGRLYGETGRRLTSPELEAKRARLNALRAERDLLRDLDTATIEAKKEAQLEKAIENAQKAIPEPKEGTPTVDTERVAQLKQTLKEVREARSSSPEAMRAKMDAATDSVRKSIAEYDRRLREGDTSRSSSQDPLRSNDLDALRSERDALERAYHEMVSAEKPKKSRDEIALQAYKTRTASRIAELEEKIAKGDFGKAPRKMVMKDAAADKLSFELDQQKKAFQEGLLKHRLNNRTWGEKITDSVKETFHTLRAIMTGGEFSGLLRQGKFSVLSRPITTFKGAVPAMFKAFRSEAGEHAIMREIHSRPNADLYKKAGLEIHDPNNFTAAQLEGNYRSRWANKIPFIAGSGRAYTVFLNRVRADVFDLLEMKLRGREGPVSVEQARAIATYVNESTGAGGLGVKGQKAAELLNYTFFSPKFVASRFQMLAGHSMWKGDMATRRLIAEEYARILGGAAVMYSLYSIATDKKVETDPRSSDFGKIKIGKTTVDPMAGVSQATVFLARITTGQTKNEKGEVAQLRDTETKKVPFAARDMKDTITTFTRSKLGPIPGAVYDRIVNKDFKNMPVTAGEQFMNLATPMTYGDIYDAMKAQGVPEGMALSVLAFFGESVNTYPDQKPPR